MAALTEADLTRAPAHRLAWRLAGDDQLARAAARGSDAAFAAIYDRYHAAIVRHCRGVLLDAHEAEDAAQAAMTAAFRALRGSGPQPVALRPWLYRIAHHEALAVARRRSAPGPAVEDLELPSVEDGVVRERLAELVGDLRTLPERQRGALLLRELSGLDYDEIAVALETNATNARQLVSSARGALSEVGAGRAAACSDVRVRLDEADRRALRGRGLRAHLADCPECFAYARSIRARRRDLALLFPLGPGLALLGWVGGGGAAAGGGSWALGSALGGSVAAKCAVVCATVIVGAVAVEESVKEPPKPAKPAAEQRAEHRGTTRSDPSGANRPSTAREPEKAVAATMQRVARNTAPKPKTQAKAPTQAVVDKQTPAPKPRSVRKQPSRTPAQAAQPTFNPDQPAATTPAAAQPAPVATSVPVAQRSSAPTVQQQVAAVEQQVHEQVQQQVQQQVRDVQQRVQTQLQTVQQRTRDALAAMRQRLTTPSQPATP